MCLHDSKIEGSIYTHVQTTLIQPEKLVLQDSKEEYGEQQRGILIPFDLVRAISFIQRENMESR